MDLTVINNRVDQALADNRRAEHTVMIMAGAIFMVGVAVVLVAYWKDHPYILAGEFVVQGLLYWPIREILRIRKDNIIIQTLPVMVSSLPPAQIADEVVKFLEYLRNQ